MGCRLFLNLPHTCQMQSYPRVVWKGSKQGLKCFLWILKYCEKLNGKRGKEQWNTTYPKCTFIHVCNVNLSVTVLRSIMFLTLLQTPTSVFLSPHHPASLYIRGPIKQGYKAGSLQQWLLLQASDVIVLVWWPKGDMKAFQSSPEGLFTMQFTVSSIVLWAL